MDKYIKLFNDVFYPKRHKSLIVGVRYEVISENDKSYFLTDKNLCLDKKYEGRLFKVDVI